LRGGDKKKNKEKNGIVQRERKKIPEANKEEGRNLHAQRNTRGLVNHSRRKKKKMISAMVTK